MGRGRGLLLAVVTTGFATLAPEGRVARVWAAPPAEAATAARGDRSPADADVGYLDIASDPPAKVQIDGADTGQVTPQPHLALAPGHHTLTLVTLDGKRTRTIGFQIERAKVTKLSLHLGA